MPSLPNSKLLEIAEASLRANIIPTAQGTLCVAGAHQFKTLWTRDFCYAVPGLLAAGFEDLVRRQLRVILSYMRTDGLLPRGLDVTSPKVRVINALAGNPLKDFLQYSQPLRPEYMGEHRTVAFDSNMLWLHSATLAKLEPTEMPTKKLLALYERDSHGLYDQPKYSDWMDSLKREGPQLLFHLQMWRTLRALGTDVDSLSRVIRSRWFSDQGWLRESTDTLLLAIETGFGDTGEIVAEVRRRPVGVPCIEQPLSEVSFTARVVGLRHYHDGFAWSWLAADTARVLRKHDIAFADAIVDELTKLCVNEGSVPEIYFAGTDRAVKTRLYKSEKPFSWGAGKILEALADH